MKKFIFLRGLIRHKFHWHQFPAELKKSIPDSEFYFLDVPGNGVSFEQATPRNLAKIVELLHERLERNGIDGPYNLVAVSLGAMVAMQWSLSYPGEVEKAVLINTSVSNLSHWYQRFSLRGIKCAIKFLVHHKNFRAREAAILELVSNAHRYDYHLLNRWEELHRLFPISIQTAINQLIAAARFRLKERPSGDFLIVNSQLDGLVSPSCSERLADYLESPLITNSRAGHDLPLDEPRWLAETISEWLAQSKEVGKQMPIKEADSTDKANVALV